MTIDFKINQVRANQIIGDNSNPQSKLFILSSETSGTELNRGVINDQLFLDLSSGEDIWFSISGSKFGGGKTVNFTGDTNVSGSLFVNTEKYSEVLAESSSFFGSNIYSSDNFQNTKNTHFGYNHALTVSNDSHYNSFVGFGNADIQNVNHLHAIGGWYGGLSDDDISETRDSTIHNISGGFIANVSQFDLRHSLDPIVIGGLFITQSYNTSCASVNNFLGEAHFCTFSYFSGNYFSNFERTFLVQGNGNYGGTVVNAAHSTLNSNINANVLDMVSSVLLGNIGITAEGINVNFSDIGLIALGNGLATVSSSYNSFMAVSYRSEIRAPNVIMLGGYDNVTTENAELNVFISGEANYSDGYANTFIGGFSNFSDGFRNTFIDAEYEEISGNRNIVLGTEFHKTITSGSLRVGSGISGSHTKLFDGVEDAYVNFSQSSPSPLHIATSSIGQIQLGEFSRLNVGTYNVVTTSTPLVVGAGYYLRAEHEDFANIPGSYAIFRCVLSVTDKDDTAYVKLWNATDLTYVDIGGPGIDFLSTDSQTPDVLRSVSLFDMPTGFAYDKVYETHVYIVTAFPGSPAIHHVSELLFAPRLYDEYSQPKVPPS